MHMRMLYYTTTLLHYFTTTLLHYYTTALTLQPYFSAARMQMPPQPKPMSSSVVSGPKGSSRASSASILRVCASARLPRNTRPAADGDGDWDGDAGADDVVACAGDACDAVACACACDACAVVDAFVDALLLVSSSLSLSTTSLSVTVVLSDAALSTLDRPAAEVRAAAALRKLEKKNR